MQKYLGLQICIDLQKNCKICRRRDMTTIQKEKSDPEMLFFHSAQWRGVTVCFCVLLCVPVCYRVFLCVTTCYCLLPRVTLCYCVFLCVTVCYCLFLRVTLCYCVLLCATSTVCYCEAVFGKVKHVNLKSSSFTPTLGVKSSPQSFDGPPPPQKNENNDKMQIFVTLIWVNIARGTTDPEIDSETWTKLGNNMAPLALIANLATRWRQLTFSHLITFSH